MAGNSAHWIKVPAGPKKGTRVFVSKAEMQDQGFANAQQFKAHLGGMNLITRTAHLTESAIISKQPGGQAKKGGAVKLSDANIVTSKPTKQTVTIASLKPGAGSLFKTPAPEDFNHHDIPGERQGHLAVVKTSDVMNAMHGTTDSKAPGFQIIHLPSGNLFREAKLHKDAIGVMAAINKSGVDMSAQNFSSATFQHFMKVMNTYYQENP